MRIQLPSPRSQPCGDELKSVKLKCAGNYQKQAGNCL